MHHRHYLVPPFVTATERATPEGKGPTVFSFILSIRINLPVTYESKLQGEITALAHSAPCLTWLLIACRTSTCLHDSGNTWFLPGYESPLAKQARTVPQSLIDLQSFDLALQLICQQAFFASKAGYLIAHLLARPHIHLRP